MIALGADGATTKVLAPIGAPASTVSAYSLDLVSPVFSSRPKALAAFFERWRLRGLRFEYTQFTSVSNAFVLGVVEDGAASPTTSSYSTLIEMQSSKAFNTGSGQRQEFTYRPSYNRDWLYTDAVSESTAVAVRSVSYGELWGAWYTAPTTGTFGTLTVHWDLEFRSPCPSTTVTERLAKVLGLESRTDREADFELLPEKSREAATALLPAPRQARLGLLREVATTAQPGAANVALQMPPGRPAGNMRGIT